MLVGALCCFWLLGYSQNDSLRQLKTVEILETAIRHPHIGGTVQTWDSAVIANSTRQNIAQLLEEKAHIFIKSYGQGSLATSSTRGAAAGHTAVLWNGLPIQSPMLGLLDFALLPTGFVDALDVQYGGGSALWGNGAIGAVINLKNETSFSKKKQIQIRNQLGSFGSQQQNINIGIGNKRLQSKSRLSHQRADNDFPFRVAEGFPKQKQSNAALQQVGFMQSVAYAASAKLSLEAHAWYQNTARELPPTIAQNESQARQKDKAVRIALQAKHIGNTTASKVKFGFFDEKIRYIDAATGQDAPSRFKTYMLEADRQWALTGQQQLYIGTTHILNEAWADGYGTAVPMEYQGGLFASHRLHTKTWAIQSSLRQAFFDATALPLIPVFGVERYFKKPLTFRAKVSRNYRIPTMNDRFWRPGGNPDLEAEQGWSSEIGFDFAPQINNFKCKLSSTFFNRRIKNWILWHRAEGQFFWEANNIAEVWSRGLEQRMDVFFTQNKSIWQLGIGYDFVRSTNEIALSVPRIEAGQQLFYVPEQMLRTLLSVQQKNWGLRYTHNFTDEYIGVNADLEAYHLAAFSGHFSWNIKSIPMTSIFSIDNLYNLDYQVIERRPMPGRAFQIGLSITIQ